jgi:hypothetical protein
VKTDDHPCEDLATLAIELSNLDKSIRVMRNIGYEPLKIQRSVRVYDAMLKDYVRMSDCIVEHYKLRFKEVK